MANLSKKVFIDASVFFAFINRADIKHDEASAYFRFFGEGEYILYTEHTNLIEAYDKVFKDISPSLAKDFLRTIFLSDINIIYADENDVKSALKMLITYQTNDLSYHQALTAVLANRRNIQNICSFAYFHQLFGLSLFYLPM